MKILVITPYFPPAVGGACRMLETIVLGMIDRGHTVEVLTFGETIYSGCHEFDTRQTYKIHRVKADSLRAASIVATARTLLTLIRATRFNVIFCGVAWPSGVLAMLAKQIARVPYVIYTHGEDTTIVVGSRWKAPLLRNAFRRSLRVFINSKFSLKAVESLGAPSKNCEVLYPTIDAGAYLTSSRQQVEDLTKRLGVDGATILLTVARLQERKGHDIVVRSLPFLSAKFPAIHYLIVGKGDRGTLTRLADELNVRDRLTIIDGLDESDLRSIYHAASLYVMVSRWDPAAQEVEGFGMTYLEAAAAGKPSVAGNHGGVSDAVVDGVTGILVDPTSVEQTSEAIAALLSDPDLAMSMGAAGQARAVQEFGNEKFLNRIDEVLTQAARR